MRYDLGWEVFNRRNGRIVAFRRTEAEAKALASLISFYAYRRV